MKPIGIVEAWRRMDAYISQESVSQEIVLKHSWHIMKDEWMNCQHQQTLEEEEKEKIKQKIVENAALKKDRSILEIILY